MRTSFCLIAAAGVAAFLAAPTVQAQTVLNVTTAGSD